MSKNDRQKLSILVILLAVLALTLVLGYQMNRPAVTAAVQPPETKTTPANPPAPSDARIRLDLIEKPEAAEQEVGRKNVFQYGQTGTPGSGARGAGVPAIPPPPAPVTPQPISRPPAVNVPPPGPPPIPLKYQGYAVAKTPGGDITAFLVDDASRHYNAKAGEILMGRYRVAQVSNSLVEIEDLDNNRRQTLPLLK